MAGGYWHRILRFDLTTGKQRVEELDEATVKAFIGGVGLGAKYLIEGTGRETDPLGPENLLIFTTGPYTATKIPLSGRHAVVIKSPLTNGYGESDVGGTWGTQLKRVGYDGLIISGRADRPVYLWIHEGGVELRDASHLWGQDTYEVDEALRRETDPKATVAAVGQAGERMARIAAIMTDGRDGRAMGRCGPGAVMGSKRLKAIVVKGERDPPLADPEGLARSIREVSPMVVKKAKALHDYGTSGGTMTIEKLGDLPIKNWLEGSWPEGAEKLAGQTLAKTILVKQYYCGACIIGCGRVVRVGEGKYAPVDGGGPEYETVAMLGALNLVDDLKAVAKAHELCNRYGLDVISTGAVVAFAIEAYERGLLTSQDTGGLKLRWGDPDVMVALVELIGRREGLGWLLGEGVARAASRLGPGAEDLAIHVKGLELPGHDPRAHFSQGLSYATSNRGACHLASASHIFERVLTLPELGYPEVRDRFQVEGIGEFVVKTQNLMSMMDSLKICKFVLFGGVGPGHMVEWLRLVTGWDIDLEWFMRAGDRIYNIRRLYNVKCGFTRKDDTLPKRILSHRRGSGGAPDTLPPLEEMLEQYYRYRGWDGQGIPTPEKLRELGLEQYAVAPPAH
jgi:aldehyde:ferredoxin oxidoreductase